MLIEDFHESPPTIVLFAGGGGGAGFFALGGGGGGFFPAAIPELRVVELAFREALPYEEGAGDADLSP